MRQIWRKIDNITADHRKGVNDMYCHKCGAVLNDRALFCSKCGAKVDKKVQQMSTITAHTVNIKIIRHTLHITGNSGTMRPDKPRLRHKKRRSAVEHIFLYFR